MPEEIKLGVATHDTEVSYINLYKRLEDVSNLNEEVFRKVFDSVQFEEEIGVEYNSLPIYVGYSYIPVILDGLVDVKMLKIEQGNGIAIILPEDVASTYKAIEEDITLLDKFNTEIDLVGDLYGFDENDPELTDLIKMLYVNAGNKVPAYKLTTKGEAEYNKEKEPEEDGFESSRDFGGFDRGDENISFSDIEPIGGKDIESTPEITVNEEAYKRFSKDTKELELYLDKLYYNTPKAVRENIAVRFIADNKVLLINVDNKGIYETFATIPKHARTQISTIGESIRLNKHTQLVDSFKYGDGRVFVLVENSHSNIWTVKDEEIKPLNEKRDKKVYISKKYDIIELEQSSVRQENRRFVPRLKNGKTVFSVK